jgi:hypothetical protein
LTLRHTLATRKTKIKRILNPPKPARDIYNWDREPRDPDEDANIKKIAKAQISTNGISFADFNTYVEEMYEQNGKPTDIYLVSEIHGMRLMSRTYNELGEFAV